MQNLSFEEQFVKVAKGLPDLERIVSRIHAKNCKVKDFLKVLSVSSSRFSILFTLARSVVPWYLKELTTQWYEVTVIPPPERRAQGTRRRLGVFHFEDRLGTVAVCA